MTVVVWALAALVVGALLGGLTARRVQRSRELEAQVVQPAPTAPVDVVPEVVEVVNLLRSAGMVIGPHDQVLHSNPQARSLGLCRGDRVMVDAVLDRIREARRTGRPAVFDTSVRRGSGVPDLPLHVRISMISDEIELVLAEDRTPLLRVDETRRDFVANVSHELKTPIGAIQLLSEAVEGAADDPEAVRHFAARMHTESHRLGELVTQIIALSRLQSDDPMLDASLQPVGELISLALDRCHELATSRKVNLVRTGDEAGMVLGDQLQLVDAIANLVQNAIVYSDPKARVAVVTSRLLDGGESFVEISVSDNGIGISPEDQQRIFERFYRVDYARSRGNGGTGLGLSIVKHITAVHGGQVNVWSKPGQGSTFTIRLPEAAVQGADKESHPAASGQKDPERTS